MIPDNNCVAVILAVTGKDDAEHFKLALSSINNQDYDFIKLFVYCDGPLSAYSERVLQDFIGNSARHNVVIRGDVQMGLAFGLNRLIDSVLRDSDVKFVARMDADDFSMPHRLSTQVLFLLNNPRTAVVGSWCVESRDMSKPNFHKELPCDFDRLRKFALMRSPLVHPSVMFRRSVFEDGLRYDKNLKVMQDYDLWTRLILDGYELANIPEYLLWFRVSEDFFKRRTGFKRAISEIQMRIAYARASRLLEVKHVFLYSTLFILRIAPSFLKRFGYSKFR